MNATIENSTIKQYEKDVHLAYQRQGSKFRNTIRTKNGVTGTDTTFQKVGKGEASERTGRASHVPTMSIDHSTVTCTMKDYTAADYIDKFDTLKINHDERDVVVKSGSYALGRKTDAIILAAMEASSNVVLDGTTGMTKAKALAAFETLGNADIPDDGERYAWVGYKQWSELMGLPEFANEQYVGEDALPWPGVQAKKWLGTVWMPHSGLTLTSGVRRCVWYHKTAVGHAIASDVKVEQEYKPERMSWFVNHFMSMGACLIDSSGVAILDCKET